MYSRHRLPNPTILTVQSTCIIMGDVLRSLVVKCITYTCTFSFVIFMSKNNVLTIV